MQAGALLDALRGVHWPARSLTASTVHGEHRSLRAGASPEFMDYRAYHQGDDAAKIDWKLFGRTERVAVRLAHDDSSLPTTVLVDASASMAFPANGPNKWLLATRLALGLAGVAHGDGDPIGVAIAGGTSPRTLAPRTRRGTLTDIMRVLEAAVPEGTVPLAPSLASLRSSKRIAIVSDFLGDADDVLRQARALISAGTELYAIHVVAREELDPPVSPLVVDPEDPLVRRPLGSEAMDGYRVAFQQWREGLAGDWQRSGAVYRLAVTDEEPARVVRRIVATAAASRA